MSQLEKTFIITESQLRDIKNHAPVLRKGIRQQFIHKEGLSQLLCTLDAFEEIPLGHVPCYVDKILDDVKRCPAK